MHKRNRHPAYPAEKHVTAFLNHLVTDEIDGGRGNAVRIAKEKCRKLNQTYEHWQLSDLYPHEQDYNPFKAAQARMHYDKDEKKERNYPRIFLPDLREKVADVAHSRRLAIICHQLKLGLRAGEVTNIKLADFDIQNAELHSHYDELGTHDKLRNRENGIYIPSKYERKGNNSENGRTLPLDDELRRVIIDSLFPRPDNGEPWLFLSETSNTKLKSKTVNEDWKKEFHPDYANLEVYDDVTSHFGRHYFSTYWRIEEGIDRERIFKLNL
ncbi:tyrosine-type recombinase/integrase [Haladaptatus sp. DFWS20]|uniref:tyrosine-type recombinase/integrase n=1 Tax=Haladaptatus sp. DFWS20 TaxID=3403467 RepID=UPI003EB6DEA6